MSVAGSSLSSNLYSSSDFVVMFFMDCVELEEYLRTCW